MILEESILINCEFDKAYAAFANPYSWKEIFPNVVEVCVIYNDGRNQEFTMTVEKSTHRETVHSIRYCLGDRILVFQPEPPPKVRKLSGEWHFSEENGKTKVLARRELELEGIQDENNMTEEEALLVESFKASLIESGKYNLLAFKNKLESI